jgi:RNA-splicing ligase RtcB
MVVRIGTPLRRDQIMIEVHLGNRGALEDLCQDHLLKSKKSQEDPLQELLSESKKAQYQNSSTPLFSPQSL